MVPALNKMVTMFEKELAQGADTLMPGRYHVQDWDAHVLVMPQAPLGGLSVTSYTVVLLNEQGHALAQCSWAAADTETFAEPIRLLRDHDFEPQDEPSYHAVRYVAACDC